MGTWDKDVIFVELAAATTASADETSHTIKFQPINQAYDTGAVSGTQGSSRQDRWFPSSDLNDQLHYDIYIDDIFVARRWSPNSLPLIDSTGGTWDRNKIFIEIVTATTGANDTSAHDIRLQPVDPIAGYPTGAITCSQGSSRADRWFPDSNLDYAKHYDLYKNGTKIDRIFSPYSLPMLEGGGGTWDKDSVFVEIAVKTTAAEDITAHTVKFQPVDQTYDSGAITATQGSGREDRWYPSSDLSYAKHYDVYIEDVWITRIFSPKSLPMIEP